MAGFVRAMVVEEQLLLGPRSMLADRGIAMIDEARRRGIQVILMSGRTFEELRREASRLLSHVDAVVADSGAVLSVGRGPARRVPLQTRRAALLEVLDQLDVDPHEALGCFADDATDLRDALEVWVATDDDGGHRPAGSRAAALDRVLGYLRGGWSAGSPRRHDRCEQCERCERYERHGRYERYARYERSDRFDRSGRYAGALDLVVPGARANLLLCASADDVRDVPLHLAVRWSGAGYQTLVLDLSGWSAQWSAGWSAGGREAGEQLGPGDVRIDAGSATWSEQLATALHDHRGLTVLDLSSLSGRALSATAGAALSAVRFRRSRTGRPHWLVIDPAEVVLADPDLPPEVLDLRERGHCLVLRHHDVAPPWLPDAVDAIQPCSRGCAMVPENA